MASKKTSPNPLKLIADAVAKKHGLPKRKAMAIARDIMQMAADLVGKGQSLTLPGLGTLDVWETAEQVSRNRRTGKEVRKPAYLTVEFVPTRSLKRALKNPAALNPAADTPPPDDSAPVVPSQEQPVAPQEYPVAPQPLPPAPRTQTGAQMTIDFETPVDPAPAAPIEELPPMTVDVIDEFPEGLEESPAPPAVPKDPTVFTIAPSQPFLDAIARGVLDETGGDPMKLADYTIMVPNRETGYELQQAFMRQMDGAPGILPRIDTPGDVDGDYLSLSISGSATLSQELMNLPPPISRLDRQLILAGEVLKMPGMSRSVQKATDLAATLGTLIDNAQRHNVSLSNIDKLVPELYQSQWQKTADFLKIVTETWPQKLRDIGKIDPEEHRNRLMEIEMAYWREFPPQRRIIAAGFTDTAPAMLKLLRAVATMPNGSVVLPGLDRNLDQKSWDVLTEVHGQFGFRKMLDAMGVDRAAVNEWPAKAEIKPFWRIKDPAATHAERETLLREAMRPSGTAEDWSNLKAHKKSYTQALNGVEFQTFPTPQEEASVIALKMRETLEELGRTAMLVTADRELARRVSTRLRRYKIEVGDSAGMPLSDTPAGIFLMSTAFMAAEEWKPARLLEALKHPLATLGDSKEVFDQKVVELEDTVLHGPRPGFGAEGLKHGLTAVFNRASKYRKHDASPLTPKQLAEAHDRMQAFVDKIQKAGAEFFGHVSSGDKPPFLSFIDAHIRFAEALAETGETPGAERLWSGEDGAAAARFFTRLRDAAQHMPPVSGADYAEVLFGLMRKVEVSSGIAQHPLLKIVTPAQALLTKADTVIVSGLNDESWPRTAGDNPWLSAEMMKKLGLPAAKESVGRDAHRFTQAISNSVVFMTRAMRSGMVPTVASPFLKRLLMVLDGAGLTDSFENRSRLLDIHTALHTPPAVTPIAPPAPTPALEHRPKQLSVTSVQTLMHDPFSIYARDVLKLRSRSRLEAGPSPAEKGSFTHDALDAFVTKYPRELPPNAEKELLDIGAETFKSRMNNPTVRAFWWPRFERIAKWFVKFETERREAVRTLGTEVKGKLTIDLGDGSVFTLSAIADRLDVDREGNISVIDYKTGSVPLQKAVALGFSPQLTLEAVIVSEGGFSKIPAREPKALQYWKLSGGRPAADITNVSGDIKQLIEEAKDGVTRLMQAFNDPQTPYLSSPWPDWKLSYNDYAHLAREKEWNTVKRIDAVPKAPRAKKSFDAAANDDKEKSTGKKPAAAAEKKATTRKPRGKKPGAGEGGA